MVMNYSEVESKVREATNDEAWGPHGTLMSEIARETFTYEHFPEVVGMLWKRLLYDNKKSWRRVYKVSCSILLDPPIRTDLFHTRNMVQILSQCQLGPSF